VAAVLAAASPGFRAELPSLARPVALAELAALMACSGLLSASGALSWLADRAAAARGDPRLGLVLASLLLGLAASLVTNDAAVFVAVPVAAEMAERSGLPRWLAVGAATVGVNVGSSLLPLGNPQNLLIWHDYGVPLAVFALRMVPLVAAGLALDAAAVLLLARRQPAVRGVAAPRVAVDRRRALAGAAGLAAVASASALGAPLAGSLMALLLAALAWPRSLLAVDPWVLSTLALMFADFSYLGSLLAPRLPGWVLETPLGTYLAALALSQLVSNVPAAAALSLRTPHWEALAYGANVGGVVLFTGSLANMVALRLSGLRPRELHRFQLRVAAVLAPLAALLLAAR